MLKSILGIFYVILTLYIIPFIVYFFAIPSKYYSIFFWIAYGVLVITNLLIILETIYVLIYKVKNYNEKSTFELFKKMIDDSVAFSTLVDLHRPMFVEQIVSLQQQRSEQSVVDVPNTNYYNRSSCILDIANLEQHNNLRRPQCYVNSLYLNKNIDARTQLSSIVTDNIRSLPIDDCYNNTLSVGNIGDPYVYSTQIDVEQFSPVRIWNVNGQQNQCIPNYAYTEQNVQMNVIPNNYNLGQHTQSINRSIELFNLKLAIIFPIYLDNEKDIIKDTIDNIIKCYFPHNTYLIITYNTKEYDDTNHNKLISLLKDTNRKVVPIVLYNKDSKSKSDNINGAIDYLQFHKIDVDYCSIFDADHQPDKYSILYALHILSDRENPADIVQGRVYIRSPSTIIAIEFNLLYCIFHEGGYRLRTHGIFGGTNGHWRFYVLSHTRFSNKRLTEDIDASYRALENGTKIVYNNYVTSSELAPPNLKSLLRQRLRWCQGWTQVSFLQFIPMCTSDDVSLRIKICTFFVLIWRELYHYIAAHLVSILVASGIYCSMSNNCVDLLYYLPTIVILFLPALLILVLYFIEFPVMRQDLRYYHYMLYALLFIPYEIIKANLCIYGHAKCMMRSNTWKVTSRK